MATETAPSKKPKLGEILVKYGIITQNMLKNALRRQSQVGGQIGSVLIEMGYITTDTLLDFLSKQFGVPAVNLFKLDIPSDMLKALPIEKIKDYKVLPLEIDNKLTLAMVNPKDYIDIRDVEFILGKRVNTVVVPSLQFNAAIKSIETTGMGSFKGCEIEQSCEIVHHEGTSDMNTLLRQMMETQATDLQLTAGVPPSLKMSSELRRVNMPPLTPENMKEYARTLMNPEQQARFDQFNDLDFAFTDKQFGRFRVNIYKQRNSVSITIRRIPETIPTLHELGLPGELESYALKTQGLILITAFIPITPSCL